MILDDFQVTGSQDPSAIAGEVVIIDGWSSIIMTNALTHGGLGQVVGEREALVYDVGIALERSVGQW